MKKIAYVGIDYHENSLSLAVRVHGITTIHETVRLRNDDKMIRTYLTSFQSNSTSEPAMKPPQAGIRFNERWNPGVTPAGLLPPPRFRKNEVIAARTTPGMPGTWPTTMPTEP
jgi:hypothetical protein